MKMFVLPVALLFAGLAFAPLTSAKENQKMETEENRVINAVEKMTEAFHASNIDTVMESYEAKATVVFEPGKPISDPVVLRQMFQGAFSLNPRFSYSGHEVFVSGDIAVHFAPWNMTGRTPDNVEVSQSGLSVAVLRKQSDGEWKMVIDNPHGQFLLQK